MVFGLASIRVSPSTRHALTSAWRRPARQPRPATRAATFCSATTFQRVNPSVRVIEIETDHLGPRGAGSPLLDRPRRTVADLEKDMSGRLAAARRGSFSPRNARNWSPCRPVLKMRASRVQRSMMPPSFHQSSATDWIKHSVAGARSWRWRGSHARCRARRSSWPWPGPEAIGPVQPCMNPLRRVRRRTWAASMWQSRREGPGIGRGIE